MTTKSLGDYIMLDPEEVPTAKQIEEAVERLKKDFEILSKMRGNNDPDPQSLQYVSSFLEMLAQKYKKRLKKK